MEMKKICGIILVLALFAFSGCALMDAMKGNGKDYSALAKEKSFESFFPSQSKDYTFDSIDEAYDFVQTAQAKFTQSSGKSKAKGLGARLSGPTVTGKKPVTVSYFLEAFDGKNVVDFNKIDKPLEKVIKDSPSVGLCFLIFYKDRAASLSNFHLASGWAFNSNSQYRSFTFNSKTYEAEYPIGWNTDKVFSYLMKEID
jgi:predicted small secreted protein